MTAGPTVVGALVVLFFVIGAAMAPVPPWTRRGCPCEWCVDLREKRRVALFMLASVASWFAFILGWFVLVAFLATMVGALK